MTPQKSLNEYEDHIIHRYTIDYWSANRIAKEIGFSRQAVVEALKSWGFNTAKSKVLVPCQLPGCTKSRWVFKSEIREKLAKGEKFFCSIECFQRWFKSQFE